MRLFLRIPRVARAFEFMVNAHKGQTYGDLPYFIHPLMVAEEVYDSFPHATEDALIIALLHDVDEDTKFSLADIEEKWGANVARGVGIVTKDNDLDYAQNINRVITSQFEPAIMVKWADNRVNMSGDKSFMKPERRDKLNKQYAESFVLLSSVLGK